MEFETISYDVCFAIHTINQEENMKIFVQRTSEVSGNSKGTGLIGYS
jgi:hypothetical protein